MDVVDIENGSTVSELTDVGDFYQQLHTEIEGLRTKLDTQLHGMVAASSREIDLLSSKLMGLQPTVVSEDDYIAPAAAAAAMAAAAISPVKASEKVSLLQRTKRVPEWERSRTAELGQGDVLQQQRRKPVVLRLTNSTITTPATNTAQVATTRRVQTLTHRRLLDKYRRHPMEGERYIAKSGGDYHISDNDRNVGGVVVNSGRDNNKLNEHEDDLIMANRSGLEEEEEDVILEDRRKHDDSGTPVPPELEMVSYDDSSTISSRSHHKLTEETTTQVYFPGETDDEQDENDVVPEEEQDENDVVPEEEVENETPFLQNNAPSPVARRRIGNNSMHYFEPFFERRKDRAKLSIEERMHAPNKDAPISSRDPVNLPDAPGNDRRFPLDKSEPQFKRVAVQPSGERLKSPVSQEVTVIDLTDVHIVPFSRSGLDPEGAEMGLAGTRQNRRGEEKKEDEDRIVRPEKNRIVRLDQVKDKTIRDPYGDQGEYTGVLLRGKPHGHGVMRYRDGREYDGEWENGRWHGQGKTTYCNGDSYDGGYEHDQRHGEGRYCWSDGRTYHGDFVRDQREGSGVYTWTDGSIYTGDFHNGLRHGQGVYEFADGSCYTGEFKEGKYHGVGECLWADGRSYRGEFREGRAHGYGVETRADGSIRHDGQWRKDRPVRVHEKKRQEPPHGCAAFSMKESFEPHVPTPTDARTRQLPSPVIGQRSREKEYKDEESKPEHQGRLLGDPRFSVPNERTYPLRESPIKRLVQARSQSQELRTSSAPRQRPLSTQQKQQIQQSPQAKSPSAFSLASDPVLSRRGSPARNRQKTVSKSVTDTQDKSVPRSRMAASMIESPRIEERKEAVLPETKLRLAPSPSHLNRRSKNADTGKTVPAERFPSPPAAKAKPHVNPEALVPTLKTYVRRAASRPRSRPRPQPVYVDAGKVVPTQRFPSPPAKEKEAECLMCSSKQPASTEQEKTGQSGPVLTTSPKNTAAVEQHESDALPLGIQAILHDLSSEEVSRSKLDLPSLLLSSSGGGNTSSDPEAHPFPLRLMAGSGPAAASTPAALPRVAEEQPSLFVASTSCSSDWNNDLDEEIIEERLAAIKREQQKVAGVVPSSSEGLTDVERERQSERRARRERLKRHSKSRQRYNSRGRSMIRGDN